MLLRSENNALRARKQCSQRGPLLPEGGVRGGSGTVCPNNGKPTPCYGGGNEKGGQALVCLTSLVLHPLPLMLPQMTLLPKNTLRATCNFATLRLYNQLAVLPFVLT